jgi:Flp pilus assembly protein TadD
MLVAWAAALALGAGAIATGEAAWRQVPHPRPLEELSYYPSGRHLKAATFGHAESAADLAWLRAVQYYGAHRMTDNQFTQMAHVFDILTSLAPGFQPAYVFGAFALAQEGQDFRQAEALMLKGLDANPASGTLAFQLGFLYYVRPGGRELRRAGEMFERSSRQPDAPPQAARFAAFARQNSGDLRVAHLLWARVAQTSPNAYLREIAEKEMRRIEEALASGRLERARHRLTTPRVLLGTPPAPRDSAAAGPGTMDR